jgi:hypothetical protein
LDLVLLDLLLRALSQNSAERSYAHDWLLGLEDRKTLHLLSIFGNVIGYWLCGVCVGYFLFVQSPDVVDFSSVDLVFQIVIIEFL